MGRHSRALAQRALEVNQLALVALTHQVEGSASLVPRATSPGWHGPTSIAFQHACATLRSELDDVVHLLRTAQRDTEAALRELEMHA
jgi:hypothetical protein